ncbi:MAG: MnhB domain-containing protein [Candidatus Hadarchaeales archaeon]
MMAGMTVIVRTIARLLFPFILLFGAYIIVHGHLSPGGGFPGGAVVAAGVVSIILAFGVKLPKKLLVPEEVEGIEIFGSFFLMAICAFALVAGAAFLQNLLPIGTPGELLSAEILFLLYIAVGLKVAGGLLLIIYAMTLALQEE